ncbi:transcription initiation factor TFIID component TAF4 [Auriculariales sp. MPI-PUGE-AT-0066]|nr:transcription initiation factor TFIID component TAF4 [Auriculariales sp. MPI-PUGE-AT-0066]
MTPQPPPQLPAPHQRTSGPTAGSSSGGGPGGELHDVSTLNDSLASAGVDLKAEEENLRQQAGSHRRWADSGDRTKRSAQVDTKTLATTVNNVARHHRLARGAQDEAVQYLALALKARLTGLLTAMLAAEQHRTGAGVSRPAGIWDPHNEPEHAQGQSEEATGATPMWHHTVRRDVGLQLRALEKAEREEEQRTRKERKERLDAQAAALAAMQAPPPMTPMDGGMFDDDDGPAKKKRKKEPSNRNMSEDVRKKMSNAVASQAAGISTKKYAWMTDGAGSGPPKIKSKATNGADSAPSTPAATPGASGTAASPAATNGKAKQFVPGGKGKASAAGATGYASATPALAHVPERTLTLRDAMFVITRERGHGGGRGAARGWT